MPERMSAEVDQESPARWFAPRRPAWPDAEAPPVRSWSGGHAPLPALTERDREVLRLLADGESTAGIARELAYSESMIKYVIHGVVSGIGARNRAHAVALAIRAGVI